MGTNNFLYTYFKAHHYLTKVDGRAQADNRSGIDREWVDDRAQARKAAIAALRAST